MKETIPTAVWEGTFIVFGVTIHCYVLDDGRRIIEAESFKNLMDALYHGDASRNKALEDLCRWIKGVDQ